MADYFEGIRRKFFWRSQFSVAQWSSIFFFSIRLTTDIFVHTVGTVPISSNSYFFQNFNISQPNYLYWYIHISVVVILDENVTEIVYPTKSFSRGLSRANKITKDNQNYLAKSLLFAPNIRLQTKQMV